MWIDHCTLALQGSPLAIQGLDHLGTPLSEANPWVPGTARHLIPLANAVIEVVSLKDPLVARRTVWGRALVRFLRHGDGIFRVTLGHPDLEQFMAERRRYGVRWWPPIRDHIAGADGRAFPVQMTQIDPAIPWVVQYLRERRPTSDAPLQLAAVTVGSPTPTLTAQHYQWMLGLPTLAPTELVTDNARLVVSDGDPGYQAIELLRDTVSLSLKPHARRLRITVT